MERKRNLQRNVQKQVREYVAAGGGEKQSTVLFKNYFKKENRTKLGQRRASGAADRKQPPETPT